LTDKHLGGRFDGTDDDPYDVFYVATPGTATSVAFWERMQDEVELKPLTSEQFIFRSKLDGLNFLHLRNVKRLRLTDVRDHLGARRFLARIKVLQGDDRLLTRAWASFMRRRAPKNHGLLYRSMMATVSAGTIGGDAAVLMQPICGPQFFEQVGDPVPLSSGPGLREVKLALKNSGVGLA